MSTCQDLLFELGCEELPPKSLLNLSKALLKFVEIGLNEAELSYSSAQSYATPRRLAFIIKDLNNTQPDKSIEKRGPAVQAAFAKDGTASKAAMGFAKGCETTVENLGILKTDKGEWLAFKQEVKGLATEQLIPEIIKQSISLLPIAKRMRWGNYATEFVRPVHWCVLLFGSDVIDAEILGLKTGNQSQGHRFHAPQQLLINTPDVYLQTLEQQGKVIADFILRQNIIKDKANVEAETVDGIAHIEEYLLEEITALNEWPIPVLGNFDKRFLDLPIEVLITTMQTNQKYFPIKNTEGNLLPHFITFSNIESTNPVSIQQGNERVIMPRLADAEFFWNQDRKQTLQDRVTDLKSIVFQKTLGTVADKTIRVENIAAYIAKQLNADIALAKRAAQLAKTDLLTNMVSEFASLQGIMGRYYALADNEPSEVAIAIEEQYFPKQSGSPTPASSNGQILSLAEKIDTLSGIFSAGLIPTGDKDPYALRRATLGSLRIIIENKLDLDLIDLIAFALAQYSHDFDKKQTMQILVDFVFERLKGYCLDHGHTVDEFEAVISVKASMPLDFMQRLQAVKAFRKLPEAASLAAANKRIINILKKTDTPPADTISGLIEAEEIQLHQASIDSAKDIQPLLAQKNYQQTLTRLAQMEDTVDAFFDNVMVNTDNLPLRASRLALLSMLSNQFLEIADISKLQ
ncbi:MAG: glycine--tRNA ligase subunit beta [Methylococcales symbiont of Hymedesmia sp. n. MRB-2018]|nr:MAG: glycine--tRNA ligase subunit beta [Methylococcales symbiont of Hymedesmia sp. n. MRB-2018]